MCQSYAVLTAIRFFLHDPSQTQPHSRTESRALFVALLLQPASGRTFCGITKEAYHSMHTGTTSVFEFASRRQSRCAIVARVGLAVAIACVSVTGAFAPGAPGSLIQQTAAASGRKSTSADGTTHRACYGHAGNGVAGDAHGGGRGRYRPRRDRLVRDPAVRADDRRRGRGRRDLTLSFTDPASNEARTIITPGAVRLTKRATPGGA